MEAVQQDQESTSEPRAHGQSVVADDVDELEEARARAETVGHHTRAEQLSRGVANTAANAASPERPWFHRAHRAALRSNCESRN